MLPPSYLTLTKNSLKKYTALKSICEYIWNGFDAKATEINIDTANNDFGFISSIRVSDNGYGINRDLLDEKFRPFFQSEKIYDPNIKQSDIHGKNGVGRLTFLPLHLKLHGQQYILVTIKIMNIQFL